MIQKVGRRTSRVGMPLRKTTMDTKNSHDDWQPCSTGDLSRLAARLNTLQSGARFRQLVGTGLLSMFLCALGVVALGGFVLYEAPSLGGISCRECQAHAAEFHDYLVGKNATMDADLVKHLKKHLKKCNGCRAKLQQAYPDLPPGPLATCEPCMHHCTPKLSVGAPAGL